MATENLDSSVGKWQVIDKRRTSGASTSPGSSTNYAAMKDMSTTDAALVTANGTYWTQARLDQTCLSDKLYWLRLNNDAAGIS